MGFLNQRLRFHFVVDFHWSYERQRLEIVVLQDGLVGEIVERARAAVHPIVPFLLFF